MRKYFLIAIGGIFLISFPFLMAESKIRKGDAAPDFTLTSQDGKMVSLSQFKGKKSVVLFFYPKDNTPGCTAEACTFRDSYEDFVKAGAEVIGISSDSEESHQGFASKHRLPFILLSDPGAKVRKLFGVPSTLGLFPGRVTYVIDKNGIVQMVFSSQFKAQKHVSEALDILNSISKP